MSHVLLAHGPGADSQARQIAAQLNALGFAAGPKPAAKARPKELNAARRVIVLWSRASVQTPALRAAARRAKAAGKLISVRLDSTRPPRDLAGATAVSLPRGPRQHHAWRRLLALRTPAPCVSGAKPARKAKAAPPRRPMPKRTRRTPTPTASSLPSKGTIMASDVRRQPTGASRLSGVIALLVVTLAVCTALYVRGGDFAAWLDGLIAQGRAAVG